MYDLDSLFELCVYEIPKLLQAKECSIFTVVRGSAKAEPRLVLRKTSYRKSKNLEGRASYAEGVGLTGWVWKNRCPLRLTGVPNTREMARYPGLKWSQIVNDSNLHKEWLGVPLFGRSGDVIGVIRVPEKQRTRDGAGGGFDFRDEILLMMIGQHVAHEIELHRARERTLAALRISQDYAVRLYCAEDLNSIAKMTMDATEKIFTKTGKAHFFNVFNRDEGKFRIQEARGSLTANWMKGREVTKDSLSGNCIETNKAKIIHNIPKALNEGHYFEFTKGVECAMSVPICWGNEIFGTLTVGTDRRYEFSEEPDLHILKDMASIAAAALARLGAEELAQQNLQESVRGVAHTLSNRIPTMKNWLSILKRKADRQFAEEIYRLEESIDFIIRAIDVAKQFGRMAEPMNIRPFELRLVLEGLERLYTDRRIDWKYRGRLQMNGDPQLIEQVVLELVSNALRFVPKRHGKVRVSAYRRKTYKLGKANKTAVYIRVDDNGPGIPPGRKKYLFKPSMTTNPSAHFGLGLSFVQSVVHKHGGYVEECGSVGYGASFRIVFPQ